MWVFERHSPRHLLLKQRGTLIYLRNISSAELNDLSFARGISKKFSQPRGACGLYYLDTCSPRVIASPYGELTGVNQFQVTCSHWDATRSRRHFFASVREPWREHIEV